MPQRYLPIKKKRPNYGRRRLFLLLLLLLPFATWFGYGQTRDLVTVKAEGSAPRIVKAEPVYLLLMGVDEREHDVGRSDTMMLLRLGRDPVSLDVISIPRDTRIRLKGERAKLNAAYATGGADLTTQLVADALQIPKPYYIKLDLVAFERIVDELGGVELDIAHRYYYEDPYQDLVIDLWPGEQVLDGETALKYVRLRYDGITNSDIARIERQQQFVAAMKAKFSEPSSWARIPTLITTLKRYVATNLPERDQLPLAQALFDARNSLRMSTLPGTPDDETGDWLINQAKWSEVQASWRED